MWDLWARLENKPVWKLVSDMNPDEIISLLDFGWITDELTKEDARKILQDLEDTKSERIDDLENHGFPAYQTAGWLNYEEEYLRMRLQKAKAMDFEKNGFFMYYFSKFSVKFCDIFTIFSNIF